MKESHEYDRKLSVFKLLHVILLSLFSVCLFVSDIEINTLLTVYILNFAGTYYLYIIVCIFL